LGTELLEMIIRFYGRPMQAMLSEYMQQAFSTMLRQQETMQSEMTKALQAPFTPMTELARKNMELWQQTLSATRDAFAKPGAKKATGDKVDTQNDDKAGKWSNGYSS
jgi:polyhydroxyalkanoate synthesis regulator protein